MKQSRLRWQSYLHNCEAAEQDFEKIHPLCLYCIMTREATLYYLEDKDWKLLADIVNNPSELSVYQMHSSTSKSQNYAVVSMSKETNKVVEEYGCVKYGGKDHTISFLKASSRVPLSGEESNILYLQD